METELIILKLGGSVITEKDKTDYTVRTDLLHKIFQNISRVIQSHGGLKLVMVHGAGGFVHSIAHRHNLRTGTIGDENKYKGALKAQEATQRLNDDFIEIAQAENLPVVSIKTREVVQNCNGLLMDMHTKEIENCLRGGEIPVLNGDMVEDNILELSICGGDAITSHLSTVLPVNRLFFASDIDGIYTDNPHTNKEVELIESMTMDEINSDSIKISGSHNVDTTGGLKGKLNSCKNLFEVSNSLQTIEIFNGFVPENFKKVFYRENFTHTILYK